MDPEVEYVGEENKYGVAKSETQGDQENTPVETETTKTREVMTGEEYPAADAGAGATTTAGGTDYSLDSIGGSNPTGGTDYSAATALEGGQRPATGGTDYSGASVEGGNPTGGTDFSGADLGRLPASTNSTTAAPAPEKKHHLFGL